MLYLVTGLVGMALMVIFLGYYAVTLDAIPLWIIIIAVLIMAVWEFAESARSSNRDQDGAA